MIVTVQSIRYVSMLGASAGFHKQAKEMNVTVVAMGSKPFSANVWIASHALTRMSSSGEFSNSTAVAGVLLSTGRGSNCEHEEKDLYLVYVCQAMAIWFSGCMHDSFREHVSLCS